jgi:hypothetical protein
VQRGENDALCGDCGQNRTSRGAGPGDTRGGGKSGRQDAAEMKHRFVLEASEFLPRHVQPRE